MKTVVCVKQVPDSAIVRFDLRTKTLANIHYTMDPIDEVTVSEAIKIRERTGGKVTALTLGPPRAEEVLRSCLKMGVDEAIHLCDEAFDNLDPSLTSEILARKIATLEHDLVLCGRESMDACNGFVGIGIAEFLRLPVVTAVTRIDVFADTKTAVVHRRLKGGDREIVETPLPAVLTVDVVLTKPVYPRLRTILEGLKKHITRLDAPALGIDHHALDPGFSPLVVSQPKPRLKKTATIDSSLSPHERMKLIASGGVQDKGSKTVKKHPHDAAAEIVQFLLSNGIISKRQR
jgi:electron transfer flavoprotein beta subunit